MRVSSQRRRWLAVVPLAVFVIVGCATVSQPPLDKGAAQSSRPVVRVGKPTPTVVTATTLTPEQEAGLAEVMALIEAASRAYTVSPPTIIVFGRPGDGAYGDYGRGVIMFSARSLTHPARDTVAAHEMGHYVLGHEHPGARLTETIWHAANIEAVRILQVGKEMSEDAALRKVLIPFAMHRTTAGGAPAGRGHADPCKEIGAMVAAYPDQRGWASTYECASREGR